MQPNLPHNLDAERSVLGAIILDPLAAISCLGALDADQFYGQANRRTYALLREMITAHELPGDREDTVLILEGARKRGILDEIGGTQYILSLVETVPTAFHAAQYADVVRATHTRRQAMMHCQNALQALCGDASTIETVSQTMANLRALNMGSEVETINETLKRCAAQMDTFREQQLRPWLRTGWANLDTGFVSLRKAAVVVIAGQTGMGKSTFLANLLWSFIRSGHRGLLATTEMLTEHYGFLLLSIATGIPSLKLESGHMRDEEFKLYSETMGAMSEMPLALTFARGMSISELGAIARREHLTQPLGWLAIDYRDGLKINTKAENMNQAVTQQMAEIADLAGSLEIPVLLVCQLNRALGSDDKRPVLRNLRESGSIEQIADAVVFVYRLARDSREVADSAALRNVTEIIVGKQRRGETFTALMDFQTHCGRIVTLDSQREDAYRSVTGLSFNLPRDFDDTRSENGQGGQT